jgi:hypothetical protein
MRDHRKERPENYAEMEHFWRYKLTPEDFAAMLAAQGGCAICRSADPGPAGWQVDHDHDCCPRDKRSCGRCVRGILCAHCNKAIGELHEDPDIIQTAHDYVVAWRARRELLVAQSSPDSTSNDQSSPATTMGALPGS